MHLGTGIHVSIMRIKIAPCIP